LAIATDQQVQTYVNERLRVRAEQIRSLVIAMQDDKASIDDIYAATTQPNPTWTDNRTDGPPHLLVPTDVPSFNAIITDILTAITEHSEYPNLLKACVRPVNG